jgi:tetratricopeptide (TPR) repeat protein
MSGKHMFGCQGILSHWMRLALLSLLVLGLTGCQDADSAKREYVEKGNAFFDKGRFSEAAIMYQKALQKDKRFDEAWYRMALLQIKQSQFIEAVASLRRVIEIKPQHPDANGRLLDIYALAYAVNPRNREDMMREIDALVKNLTQVDPKGFDTMRGQALLDLLRGNAKDAAAKLEKALQLRPDRVDAAVAYTQALIRSQREPEAEQYAKNWIAKHKEDYQMYDVLAGFALGRKDLPGLERILIDKMAAIPRQPAYRLALARFYAAQRNNDKVKETIQPLLDNTKDFPAGKLQAGDFYRFTGDNETAEKYYQDGWNTSQDKDIKANNGLRIAELRISKNKVDEAEKLVDDVLKLDTESREGRALKALILLNSGDKKKMTDAMARLNDLVNNDPRNSNLRFHLGRAQILNGDLDPAIASFQQAVRLNPDNILAKQALAEGYYRKNDVTQVVVVTTELLNQVETFLPARLIRADALLSQGKVVDAEVDIEKILKQAPNAPESKLVKARLDLFKGSYDSSESAYRERFNAGDQRAFDGLVRALVGKKKFSEAMEIIQVQVAANQRDMMLRRMAAEIAIKMGDLPKAGQILEDGIKVGGSTSATAPLYSRLAAIQADLGKTEVAMQTLNKSLEADPKNINALIEAGQLLERKGERAKAMEYYKRVLAVTSNQPIALNNLAYALAESNQDLDTALNHARLARQQMPEDPNVADTLGYVYVRKNLNDSAIQLYKDILTKYKPTALLNLHYAMAYAQKGDKGQAKKLLTDALQMKPTNDEEAKIREWLTKVG